MTTLEQTRAGQDQVAEKIEKLRELYADAPETGKAAVQFRGFPRNA
jgi:CHASE3 domain sensor protein